MRLQVRGWFKQSLELVAGEQGEGGAGAGAEVAAGERPDPAEVAAAVEGTLMQLCGESWGLGWAGRRCLLVGARAESCSAPQEQLGGGQPAVAVG